MAPRTPLFNPLAYFEPADRPSLSRAAVVVVVNAVLSSVFLWWFFNKILGKLNIPPGTVGEARGIVSGAAVRAFFVTFVGWLFVSGLLHIAVWFASGERGFGATAAVVGIAELVNLVLFPLTIMDFFVWLGDVPPNPTVEQSAEYLRTVASGDSLLLTLITLIGGLWKAFIQAVGLSYAHDISRGRMIAVTFVLAILSVLTT